MKSLRLIIPLLALVMLPVAISLATTGAVWVQYINTSASAEVSVMVVPNGSGPPLTQAMLYGGAATDASVYIRVVDDGGYAVPNYPRLDLWLASIDEGEQPCRINFQADEDTDTNGETSFTLAFEGGGWSAGPIWVWQHGWEAHSSISVEHPPLAMRFNSPDINGDGVVNMSDVVLFIGDYYGPYHYRSDFLWDGDIDLSDVRLMAAAIGAYCPD